MLKINYWKLLVSVLLCQLAGIIGSVFTASSVSTWYLELNKPGFNPPNRVFFPVWITLYFLMGISLYLFWSKAKKRQLKTGLVIFGIQLFLNMLWSLLFFGLKSPLLGLIEIIVLWAAIAMTIAYFYRTSKSASYLLVPYILWVSFAAVLNFYLFYLNA
ncbi:tryptophan-rich sensory protein [Candidatus Woesearchaeota archaeon]|nr:tryptophan-rich sensory protein [Candidatus Woesearchaeota archaeon]